MKPIHGLTFEYLHIALWLSVDWTQQKGSLSVSQSVSCLCLFLWHGVYAHTHTHTRCERYSKTTGYRDGPFDFDSDHTSIFDQLELLKSVARLAATNHIMSFPTNLPPTKRPFTHTHTHTHTPHTHTGTHTHRVWLLRVQGARAEQITSR